MVRAKSVPRTPGERVVRAKSEPRTPDRGAVVRIRRGHYPSTFAVRPVSGVDAGRTGSRSATPCVFGFGCPRNVKADNAVMEGRMVATTSSPARRIESKEGRCTSSDELAPESASHAG